MPYPFYYHAATSKTASQHPCRLFFAAATVAAPFFLMSGPASADLNCTEKPTCEQLGYHKSISVISCPFDISYTKCIVESATTDDLSCEEMGFTTTDKSEWCGKVINCPKNKAYTLCASGYDCSGYTFTSCPTGANCDSCLSEGKLSYSILSCKDGYTEASGTSANGQEIIKACTVNDCSGYTLTSCIANANCLTCQSGTAFKYKFDACKDGYRQTVDINTGISCVKGGIVQGCPGYPLTSCPSTAVSCDECQQGSTTKYKATACQADYMVSSGNCVPRDCSAFTLTSCPTGGICTSCVSAGTKTYQLQFCEDGYSKIGNSCQQLSAGTCNGIWCTNGTTGQRACFKENPCSTVSGVGCVWSCDATTDGGYTSGGGSKCANECQPATMNSCECKICQNSTYCINGPGSGGGDPMCCQMDKEEDSVGAGTTINP